MNRNKLKTESKINERKKARKLDLKTFLVAFDFSFFTFKKVLREGNKIGKKSPNCFDAYSVKSKEVKDFSNFVIKLKKCGLNTFIFKHKTLFFS